jgi:hypothetical protein
VKENISPVVSLYERRKPPRTRATIFFVVLLVVFLLALHFLNLFLQWTVIRLELASGPVFNSPQYSFLGFSIFNQKEITAIRYFEKSSQSTRIFGFFDFFHPVIFAVWNRKEMAFIDLGPIVMAVPIGFSRISFFPSSVFLIEHKNKIALKYWSTSPGGLFWHGFLTKKITASRMAAGELPAVSFVVKELEKSRYLKIPYLLYFFLPLLLICAVVIRTGPGMLAAFLYYVEMFFLFDCQNLFVKIPFGWIFKLINFEISAATTQFFAAALAIVFGACAMLGFWHWKKREISVWEKSFLLFFMLLPFVLFF